MNRIGSLPWRPTGRRGGKRCGDSGGHAGFDHAHGFLRHLIDVGTILRLLAGNHHVGLEHDAPGKAYPPERLGPFSGSSEPLQRTVHILKASSRPSSFPEPHGAMIAVE